MNYELLFEGFLDPVVVINQKKEIQYFNEGFLALSQMPRRKIKKESKFAEIFSLAAAELYCMPDGTVGKAEMSSYKETDYTSSSGAKGRIQVRVQPLNPAEWLVIFRDVTLEENLHKKLHAELEKKEEALQLLSRANKELEKYTEGLENIVKERTAEIEHVNEMLSGILDSVGQAFLIINQEGRCLPVYSKSCLKLFGGDPSDTKIWDFLRFTENEKILFERWIPKLFQEIVPFEDLVDLGPKAVSHPDSLVIQLEYFPIRSSAQSIQYLVLVGTDITEEKKALDELKQSQKYVERIVRISKHRSNFATFFTDTRSLIERIQKELSSAEKNSDSLRRIIDDCHTIKGGASFYALDEIISRLQTVEDDINIFLKKSVLPTSNWTEMTRSKTQEVHSYLNYFCEQNRFLIGKNILAGQKTVEFDEPIFDQFHSEMKKKNTALAAGFEEAFLKVPFASLLEHCDELVQNLSERYGKKIAAIEFVGGSTRVHRHSLDEVISILVHAMRNSVIHGIESPAERILTQKSDVGKIKVSFQLLQKSTKTWAKIELQDDGKGFDWSAIGKKIGLTQLPREELINAIMKGGVSTASQKNEFAGTGTGIHAMYSMTLNLGGSFFIDSDFGKGTRLSFEVPLKIT